MTDLTLRRMLFDNTLVYHQAKLEFMLNESRHVDYTFKEVIHHIYKLIRKEKRDEKYRNNDCSTKTLLNPDVYKNVGCYYYDLFDNAGFVKSDAAHPICLYLYYDENSSTFGNTINRGTVYNFLMKDGRMIDKPSELLSKKYKSDKICISINMRQMNNDKVLLGTLWHEFNHVRKMYINRFKNYTRKPQSYASKMIYKEFGELLLKNDKEDVYLDINKFMYLKYLEH